MSVCTVEFQKEKEYQNLLSNFYVKDHVKMALMEDIGYGDITTENLAGENDFLKGELNTRSEGVLCGCDVFKTVYIYIVQSFLHIHLMF